MIGKVRRSFWGLGTTSPKSHCRWRVTRGRNRNRRDSNLDRAGIQLLLILSDKAGSPGCLRGPEKAGDLPEMPGEHGNLLNIRTLRQRGQVFVAACPRS